MARKRLRKRPIKLEAILKLHCSEFDTDDQVTLTQFPLHYTVGVVGTVNMHSIES